MRLALSLLLVASGCAATQSVPALSEAQGMKRQEAASTRHPHGKHLLRRPHPSWASRSLRRSPVAHNWTGVARCESGGNPRAVDPSGTYFGLYQFDVQTWRSVGGHGLPSNASPAEQAMRAERLYGARGAAPWPICGRYL